MDFITIKDANEPRLAPNQDDGDTFEAREAHHIEQYNLALDHLKHSRPDQAIRLLSTLLQAPEIAQASQQASQLARLRLLAQRNLANLVHDSDALHALELYADVLAADPEDTIAWRRAMQCAAALGNVAACRRLAETALALHPKDIVLCRHATEMLDDVRLVLRGGHAKRIKVEETVDLERRVVAEAEVVEVESVADLMNRLVELVKRFKMDTLIKVVWQKEIEEIVVEEEEEVVVVMENERVVVGEAGIAEQQAPQPQPQIQQAPPQPVRKSQRAAEAKVQKAQEAVIANLLPQDPLVEQLEELVLANNDEAAIVLAAANSMGSLPQSTSTNDESSSTESSWTSLLSSSTTPWTPSLLELVVTVSSTLLLAPPFPLPLSIAKPLDSLLTAVHPCLAQHHDLLTGWLLLRLSMALEHEADTQRTESLYASLSIHAHFSSPCISPMWHWIQALVRKGKNEMQAAMESLTACAAHVAQPISIPTLSSSSLPSTLSRNELAKQQDVFATQALLLTVPQLVADNKHDEALDTLQRGKRADADARHKVWHALWTLKAARGAPKIELESMDILLSSLLHDAAVGLDRGDDWPCSVSDVIDHLLQCSCRVNTMRPLLLQTMALMRHCAVTGSVMRGGVSLIHLGLIALALTEGVETMPLLIEALLDLFSALYVKNEEEEDASMRFVLLAGRLLRKRVWERRGRVVNEALLRVTTTLLTTLFNVQGRVKALPSLSIDFDTLLHEALAWWPSVELMLQRHLDHYEKEEWPPTLRALQQVVWKLAQQASVESEIGRYHAKVVERMEARFKAWEEGRDNDMNNEQEEELNVYQSTPPFVDVLRRAALWSFRMHDTVETHGRLRVHSKSVTEPGLLDTRPYQMQLDAANRISIADYGYCIQDDLAFLKLAEQCLSMLRDVRFRATHELPPRLWNDLPDIWRRKRASLMKLLSRSLHRAKMLCPQVTESDRDRYCFILDAEHLALMEQGDAATVPQLEQDLVSLQVAVNHLDLDWGLRYYQTETLLKLNDNDRLVDALQAAERALTLAAESVHPTEGLVLVQPFFLLQKVRFLLAMSPDHLVHAYQHPFDVATCGADPRSWATPTAALRDIAAALDCAAHQVKSSEAMRWRAMVDLARGDVAAAWQACVWIQGALSEKDKTRGVRGKRGRPSLGGGGGNEALQGGHGTMHARPWSKGHHLRLTEDQGLPEHPIDLVLEKRQQLVLLLEVAAAHGVIDFLETFPSFVKGLPGGDALIASSVAAAGSTLPPQDVCGWASDLVGKARGLLLRALYSQQQVSVYRVSLLVVDWAANAHEATIQAWVKDVGDSLQLDASLRPLTLIATTLARLIEASCGSPTIQPTVFEPFYQASINYIDSLSTAVSYRHTWLTFADKFPRKYAGKQRAMLASANPISNAMRKAGWALMLDVVKCLESACLEMVNDLDAIDAPKRQAYVQYALALLVDVDAMHDYFAIVTGQRGLFGMNGVIDWIEILDTGKVCLQSVDTIKQPEAISPDLCLTLAGIFTTVMVLLAGPQPLSAEERVSVVNAKFMPLLVAPTLSRTLITHIKNVAKMLGICAASPTAAWAQHVFPPRRGLTAGAGRAAVAAAKKMVEVSAGDLPVLTTEFRQLLTFAFEGNLPDVIPYYRVVGLGGGNGGGGGGGNGGAVVERPGTEEEMDV